MSVRSERIINTVRFAHLTVGIAVAAATAVLAGSTLAAAGPSASADFAIARPTPDSIPVPSGFKKVIDDTATIAVSIPESWTVTDTSPFAEIIDDGILRPSIAALGPGSEPVYWNFYAEPLVDPLVPWDGSCDPTTECAILISTEPYEDDLFVGYRQVTDGCCASGTFVSVGANARDGQFTARLSMNYRDAADIEVFDTILQTIEPAGQALPSNGGDGSPSAPNAPVPPLPPATPAADGSIWPYGPFPTVPQLGAEPVRGSGCGSDGQVADTIPDGLWAGYVTFGTSAANEPVVNVDLLCVFYGESAQAVITEGTASIVSDRSDYLIVNNSARLRTVPESTGLVRREGSLNADGECGEGPDVATSPAADRQAWIRIDQGVATWILWDCAPTLVPSDPSLLPPPFPDSSDGFGAVWPYGEFWNAPQLGTEPVRGSGCGGEGQVGDRIPDGLWAGYVSYDPAADRFRIDLLCVYTGAAAQAVLAEGSATIVSNEPDYLVINNNDQRRTVANDLRVIAIAAPDADGRCVEQIHWLPAPGESRMAPTPATFDPLADNQAWIRLHDGAVTWLLYGCDAEVQPGG